MGDSKLLLLFINIEKKEKNYLCIWMRSGLVKLLIFSKYVVKEEIPSKISFQLTN